MSGQFSIRAAFQNETIRLEPVQPATTYTVYLVGQDLTNPPNRMSEASTVVVQTNDNVPPRFVVVAISNNVAGDHVDLDVQLDESGVVAFLVLNGRTTVCPTVDEVRE